MSIWGGAGTGAAVGTAFAPGVGTAIGAALGAAGGYFGSKRSNKKLRGISAPFQPYSGYRPPHVNYNPKTESNIYAPGNTFRPVEDLISRIVMERAQGQGVGYDPARRQELLENFKIQQDRDLEQSNYDLQNRLSGMGLSHNAAAYNDLIGRSLKEAGREKNLYTNRVDIEDLARRNQERDINTGRLQNLNTFNFGQENAVADFDLNAYRAEQGLESDRRGFQAKEAELYQDPLSTALENAGYGYALSNQPNRQPTMPAPEQFPSYDPSLGKKGGYKKNEYNEYDPTTIALIKKGYSLKKS